MRRTLLLVATVAVLGAGLSLVSSAAETKAPVAGCDPCPVAVCDPQDCDPRDCDPCPLKAE